MLTALDGGTLAFARDGAPLVTLPLDAFQIGVVSRLEETSSYDPYWLVVNDGVFTPTLPMGFAWRAATDARVTKEGEELVLWLTYNRSLTATVRAKKADDGHVVLRFVPEGTSTIGYLRVRAGVDATEAFYGLGEWFDSANHRGKLRPMQLEADLNIESAATENHVSVPFLVGSRGWGLFVQTHRHGLFDVAKTDPTIVDPMWGTAEESALGLTVHLFSAADALDVPRQYYQVTGFPRPPADGATGPWPGVDTLSPAVDPGVDSYAADPGTLWVRVQPGGDSRFAVFDGCLLEQAGGQLSATAGTRFTTSVIWELRGVPRPVSVMHGGSALPGVTDLDSAGSGFSFQSGSCSSRPLSMACPPASTDR